MPDVIQLVGMSFSRGWRKVLFVFHNSNQEKQLRRRTNQIAGSAQHMDSRRKSRLINVTNTTHDRRIPCYQSSEIIPLSESAIFWTNEPASLSKNFGSWKTQSSNRKQLQQIFQKLRKEFSIYYLTLKTLQSRAMLWYYVNLTHSWKKIIYLSNTILHPALQEHNYKRMTIYNL